jgi:hypothetical protein
MLLLRSAFWLTAMFLVMKPHTDVGATVGALSAQALSAGQHLVAEQVLANQCPTLPCTGGKALFSAVLTSTPSVESTMQDSSPVPFPRPRPDWMG